jgi:butyrate kinase
LVRAIFDQVVFNKRSIVDKNVVDELVCVARVSPGHGREMIGRSSIFEPLHKIWPQMSGWQKLASREAKSKID